MKYNDQKMSIKNDHRLDNSTTKVTIYRKNSTLIPKFLDVELDFFSDQNSMHFSCPNFETSLSYAWNE